MEKFNIGPQGLFHLKNCFYNRKQTLFLIKTFIDINLYLCYNHYITVNKGDEFMKAEDILKKEKDKKNKIRELLKEELKCALKENKDTDLQELVNKISDTIGDKDLVLERLAPSDIFWSVHGTRLISAYEFEEMFKELEGAGMF